MNLKARAFSLQCNVNRRSAIGGILSSSFATPLVSNAVPPPMYSSTPGGIQGAGGSVTRVEGVGGGFDIRSSSTVTGQDVIFPSSMAGLWNCRRVVTSVEGDSGQAELAWRNFGGKGSFNGIESYETRFILPADEFNVQNSYNFEGETLKGVIVERGFEIESRNQCTSKWSIEKPDILLYNKDASDVEIAVVQRKVELPSEKGFGFNELYRVTSSAGGIFGDNKVQRAVRIQRRYRRGFDDEGNRIVDGLEIMKTYRVLDGIAGVEMPTSTTKSQIKLRYVN